MSFMIYIKWAASWQNQQKGLCAQLRLRVFAVRMKKAWVLSYPLSAQWRLWSDWANAQADLSLLWARSHFFGFCHEVAQMVVFKLNNINWRWKSRKGLWILSEWTKSIFWSTLLSCSSFSRIKRRKLLTDVFVMNDRVWSKSLLFDYM